LRRFQKWLSGRFVHISAVEKAGYAGLAEGAKVSYELVTGRFGKVSAENLRIG
jgi:cold shock protein